jgi:DNA-directed RNA polymerase specialized sigma24 family protein
MQATKTFDDERVRLLLAGNEAEITEGLQHIHDSLRDRLCGRARNFFPGFRPQELADAWHDTLTDVLRAAKNGGIDLNRPLEPLVWTILKNKVADHFRRSGKLADAIGYATRVLQNSARAAAWARKSADEQEMTFARVRAAIAGLPLRQRVIIQVYINNFERIETLEDLRDLVSAETGQPETVVAVKRARQEALKKVREVLGDGL